MIEREPPGALQGLMCIAWFLAYTVHTRCSTSHSRIGRTHLSINMVQCEQQGYSGESRGDPGVREIFAGAQARPTLRTPLHEILDPPLGYAHKDFTKTVWQ